MAGISKKTYKTKKGIITKYTITYTDIFGKQRTSGLYDKKSDARKDLPKFENKRCDDKNITIADILNDYIENCENRKLASQTLKGYKNCKDKHLASYLDIKFLKISSLEWQNILYKIRDDVSPHIAIKCCRLLSAAFNFALKYDKITINPFLKVKNIEEPETEHNHFEIKELFNLLEICKKCFKKYYVLFFTFIATGMREGEIFGLLKENVDFENNRIKVCTQFTGGEYKEKTKTKKSKRYVYMFPTFALALKKYIESDTCNSQFVFHNSRGNPLNPSNVRQRFWVKLLKAAGYSEKHARLHDLRGSNADAALELGLSITYASNNLGHSGTKTTLKHYVKTNKAMIDDGIEKFENAFNFQKTENNLRIKENSKNSKIIQFPKSRLQRS